MGEKRIRTEVTKHLMNIIVIFDFVQEKAIC